MKKLLSTALLLSVSTFANADFLLGGDVELNAWMPDVQLNGNDVDSISSGITAEASIEHVIPLIPNIKAGLTNVSESDLTYSKFDGILYYEILDNDLVSVDLGLGLSSVEFDGSTSDFDIGDRSGVLPTAYANAEIGIPATPLFAFIKGNLSSDADSTVIDANIGFKYTFDLVAVELDLQGGYRMQELDLDDFDGATAKVDMNGAYLGLNLDF